MLIVPGLLVGQRILLQKSSVLTSFYLLRDALPLGTRLKSNQALKEAFNCWFDFTSSQIQTRYGWVGSANTTSLIYRPIIDSVLYN